MNISQRFNALREKFQINLEPRTVLMKKNADLLLNEQSDDKRLIILQDIYDEAHKLAGSAKPFGFHDISDIAQKLQQHTLKLITRSETPEKKDIVEVTKLVKELSSLSNNEEVEIIEDYNDDLNWVKSSRQKDEISDINITLVDDDPFFAAQLSDQLKDFGFNTTILSDSTNLEEHLANNSPALLIMDVEISDSEFKGTDAVNHLKTEKKIKCPVVFLSARDDFEVRLKAVRAGADGYFAKPINISDFIQFIERATNLTNEENIRVMIVDDDEYVASLNEIALKNADAETLIISDPTNVLTSLEEFEPDILLMDIRMPECDGFELAQVIRQNNKFINIPIVFLTGSNIDEAWLLSKDVGGDDYLTKDMSPAHLSASVMARAKRSREQAEAAKSIAQQKARYDALVSASKDAFITTDDQFKIIFWSKGAERLLGYTEQEVYGKHISIIYPEDEMNEAKNELDRVQSNANHHYFKSNTEKVRRHKDGRNVQLEMLITKWNIDDDTYYTGIYRDISIRKKIETQLKKNMRELDFQKKSLDEHAIVSITDVKGTILYANEKFCDISGYTSDELVGQNQRIIKSDEHDNEFFNTLWKTISAGDTWHGTIKNKRKDGSPYWVQSTIVPFLNEDGKPFQYVAIRTDITERIQTETALRIAETKLEEHNTELETKVQERTQELRQALAKVVDANRTKSEFMANMSHELRTPLNAIIGFSELIQNEYLGEIENKKYVEYAADISKSSQHLLSMINGILNIERIAVGEMPINRSYFDLNELVLENITMLKSSAEDKKIGLYCSSLTDMPAMYADQKALSQICINLLSNAIKFSHKNNKVDINVGFDGNQHIINFTDYGHGIPEDKIDTITTPFSRHQPNPHIAYDGIGLGLSITKSLIELHNGKLIIESEVDKGTSVTVKIPALKN